MSRMSYNKFIYNWVKAIRDYDKDENCQQYLKCKMKQQNWSKNYLEQKKV